MTAMLLRGELAVLQFIVYIYSILIGQSHSSIWNRASVSKNLKNNIEKIKHANTLLVLTRLLLFQFLFLKKDYFFFCSIVPWTTPRFLFFRKNTFFLKKYYPLLLFFRSMDPNRPYLKLKTRLKKKILLNIFFKKNMFSTISFLLIFCFG